MSDNISFENEGEKVIASNGVSEAIGDTVEQAHAVLMDGETDAKETQ